MWTSMRCRRVFSIIVCLIAAIVCVTEVSGTSADSEKHRNVGKQMMARGELQDALTRVQLALEKDPNNYLLLYMRATVYLAQGRARLALEDLNQVLESQPNFLLARSQKGVILIKLGYLDEAYFELDEVLKREPSIPDATINFGSIGEIKRDYKNARLSYVNKKYLRCIELVTKIIESCPWDIRLFEMRSECHLAIGKPFKAISDLKAATKIMSDNTDAFLKLSKLYYNLGELEESLNQVRECLRLDPEHKECFPHYRKVKILVKSLADLEKTIKEKNYEGCVTAARMIIKTGTTIPKYVFSAEDKLCHCYLKLGQHHRSLDFCSGALLKLREPRLFCDRAENYIAMEFLDEAKSDYVNALKMDESFSRAKEGFKKVLNLKKQPRKQDYYAILGVKRNADVKEINRAYRKMALRWHPDNFKYAKKAAEKKFIEIASAKEVLTDSEQRWAYDRRKKYR